MNSVPTVPRQVFAAALIITALVLFAFLGFLLWHRGLELRQVQAQLESAEAALAEVRASCETNSAFAQCLLEELRKAQARTAELERQKEEADRNQKLLEEEMRRAVESKDVTISELRGKLTVNILDRIMFDSGEATLKPEGEEILLRIASVLSQFPGRQVHVIGHTDNVPIRASARHRYPSNWELSTARATAAVRFLCERGGVDPRRIGAVGYGEFRPVADNNTADGRAKNRRIEIVVLPDEMVWSAATQQSSSSRPPVPGVRGLEPPATKPVASTNAVGPLVSRPD